MVEEFIAVIEGAGQHFTEAMFARKRHQPAHDMCRPQRKSTGIWLCCQGIRVVLALQDEEWRILGGDVGDGVGTWGDHGLMAGRGPPTSTAIQDLSGF